MMVDTDGVTKIGGEIVGVTKIGGEIVGGVCGEEEAGGGAGGTRDTESKTRTPHKVVGNYLDFGSRVDGAGKIMGMIN